MKIHFLADRVKISGPKIDDTYTITFETGDYAYEDIMELPKMNNGIISVEVTDEEKDTTKPTR